MQKMERHGMSYDFDQFITDVRTILQRGSGPTELEEVRGGLAKLLANKIFVERTCGPGAKGGLHRLYVDDRLEFEVLAHVNEKARKSPPHDHGASWAIYGQAIGHTDMTEYRRVDDHSNPEIAKLEVTRHYRLNPGEVGIFAGSAIHAIDYPDRSRFIRVTGTNLDAIDRVAYDEQTGRIKRMGAQQAT
jgi:predicted metal-dependent enzyme (double-stranded beta helix superfamily)